jgi:hypothetical protein
MPPSARRLMSYLGIGIGTSWVKAIFIDRSGKLLGYGQEILLICSIMPTTDWIAAVALVVCSASDFTSCATTAKSRPDSPRSLDRGVLPGDGVDDVDDVADLRGRLLELMHLIVGLPGVRRRLLGEGRGLAHLPGYLPDRGGKLRSGGGRGVDVFRHPHRGRGDIGGFLRRRGRRALQAFRRRLKLARG